MPAEIQAQAPTQDDVWKAFDFTPKDEAAAPPDGTPPAAPPPATTPPPDQAGGTEPPAEGEGKPEAPPAKPAEAERSAAKFAEMRVQIRQYETVITDVAKILGIPDTSDTAAVMTALKEAVLKAQSKQTGIPEDIIRRDRETTERLNMMEARELQAEAYTQFQKVKDAHNLSDKEISDFANQLNSVNKNPFAERMDLMTEYRLLNYDKLVEKAKQDAIKAEQARSEKARNQGSAPNQKQGTGGGAPAQVNSVRDLDALMNKM